MATTYQKINIGQFPNDQTGDSLRTAFLKINANFEGLFADIVPATPLEFDGGGAATIFDQDSINIDGGGAATVFDRILDGGGA